VSTISPRLTVLIQCTRRASISDSTIPTRVENEALPRRSSSATSLSTLVKTEEKPPWVPALPNPQVGTRWRFGILESLQITSPSMIKLGTGTEEGQQQSSGAIVAPVETLTGKPVLSKIDKVSPAGTMERNGTAKRPQQSSLHLFNMGISRRLQETSSAHFSSSSSLNNHYGQYWSSQVFGSEEVPTSWSEVLSGSQYPREPSSVYSSRPGSPALSEKNFPSIRPEIQSLDNAMATCHAIPPSDGTMDPKYLAIPSTTSNFSKTRSTPSLGKESRFKEEIGTTAPPVGRRSSMLDVFGRATKRHKERSKASDASASNAGGDENTKRKDGEQSGNTRITQNTAGVPCNSPAEENVARLDKMRFRRDATGLFAQAIKAGEAERSAFLLPEHKDQARKPQVRARSASFCVPHEATVEFTESFKVEHQPMRSIRSASESHFNQHETYLGPNPAVNRFLGVPQQQGIPALGTESAQNSTHSSQTSEGDHSWTQGSSTHTDIHQLPQPYTPQSETSRNPTTSSMDWTNDLIGAWSRYPSHTRPHRTRSAGAADCVDARDFAYDINPAHIGDDDDGDEGGRHGGPIKGLMRSISGGNRRKSRDSMDKKLFGKAGEIFRHYGGFFASPSLDYLRHGHGRRTSIAPGGEPEDPDLEGFAQSFLSFPIPYAEADRDKVSPKSESDVQLMDASGLDKGKSRLRSEEAVDLSQNRSSPKSKGALRRECSISGRRHGSIDGQKSNGGRVASQSSSISLGFPQPSQCSKASMDDGGLTLTEWEETVESEQRVGRQHCKVQKDNARPSPHGKNQSVMSIRQSSYDLLKKLAQAEEQERRKALGIDVDVAQ
jgi:hypothetical protein